MTCYVNNIIAIVLSLKEDSQVHAEMFYTLESYHKVYRHAIIHPLTRHYSKLLLYQEMDSEQSEEEEEGNVVLPPSTKSPSGHPSKCHMLSQICPVQHIIHCSRYEEVGHNKKKCTESLA